MSLPRVLELSGDPNNIVVMFHGFPGFQKNLDLATYLNEQMGATVYVPFFTDKEKPIPSFSFKGAIEQSLLLARQISDERSTPSISLVGHSWGGYISMILWHHLQNEYKDKLVLIAPLTQFPPLESRKEIIQSIVAEDQHLLPNFNLSKAIDELALLEHSHNIKLYASQFNKKRTFVLQGINDDVIDANQTRTFFTACGLGDALHEYKNDHMFSLNRLSFLVNIQRFLSYD